MYQLLTCKKPVFLFFLIIFLASCHTSQKANKIVYFQTLPKDTVLHNIVTKDPELKIKKNDILSINLASFSTEEAKYNAATGSTTGATASGYQVDDDGNIQFPKLGNVYVEGLTRAELKNKLQKDLFIYIKESLVTIHFLNHQVTVIGEVKSQVLPMPDDNLTLIQLLALSGDIQPTARKDNILVIRDTENGKQFKRLSLLDNTIFFSPFYYLKPGDIVYVEPAAKVKKNADVAQILSYALTAFNIVLTLLLRL